MSILSYLFFEWVTGSPSFCVPAIFTPSLGDDSYTGYLTTGRYLFYCPLHEATEDPRCRSRMRQAQTKNGPVGAG